jgi:hypothetical protein
VRRIPGFLYIGLAILRGVPWSPRAHGDDGGILGALSERSNALGVGMPLRLVTHRAWYGGPICRGWRGGP